MKHALLTAALCLFTAAGSFAQEESSIMDQILVISIDASVENELNETIWGMEHNTLTVSGRSVQIKLEGGNIEIYSTVTPYAKEEDSFMMVAQGEIWIKEKDGTRKHYSGADSVDVRLGEHVIFFPLGLAEDRLNGEYTLAIEIGVDLYTNLQKNTTKR